MKEKKNSSWEKAASWYDKVTGDEGHYYQKEIILPKLLQLLLAQKKKQPPSTISLVELGCGQGVVARSLPKEMAYCGVDLSESLIDEAKRRSKNNNHRFIVADATQKLPLEDNHFTHALVCLALQNISDPLKLFANCQKLLQKKGQLILILNHPCFRIPRQTSWGVDEQKKLQYRRIDSYMSPMQIPIQMHPGQKENSVDTISYHFSLTDITQALFANGFAIIGLEEWCCNKQSYGAAAKRENRARKEIPLFMMLQMQSCHLA